MKFRTTAFVVLMTAWALSFGAHAADLSPPLTLEEAKAALAAKGANVGTVFAVGSKRYAISRVDSKQVKPGTFSIILETRPLPKVQ